MENMNETTPRTQGPAEEERLGELMLANRTLEALGFLPISWHHPVSRIVVDEAHDKDPRFAVSSNGDVWDDKRSDAEHLAEAVRRHDPTSTAVSISLAEQLDISDAELLDAGVPATSIVKVGFGVAQLVAVLGKDRTRAHLDLLVRRTLEQISDALRSTEGPAS